MNAPEDAISTATPIGRVRRSPALRRQLRHKLPELLWVERLIRKFPQYLDARLEQTLQHGELQLPCYSLSFGNQVDQGVPCLLVTGAVHGVERIGVHIILSWLNSLLERLQWDEGLRSQLAAIKIVVVPMVNPIGVYANSRCNGNGVDLNRNAPVAAEGDAKLLVAGHRLSRLLPWFRGKSGEGMELENQLLERVIRRDVFSHPVATVLDIHSGFGMRDRLWFPFAFRRKLVDNIDQYLALKQLWERCYPSHNYIFEPQALHYLSHGDLWDYFYLQAKEAEMACFIPMTLELGSWAWVKKRPRQIFNFAGLFNPQKPHRRSRALRRHLVLLDFLVAATASHRNWLPKEQQAKQFKQRAEALWGE